MESCQCWPDEYLEEHHELKQAQGRTWRSFFALPGNAIQDKPAYHQDDARDNGGHLHFGMCCLTEAILDPVHGRTTG